MLRSISALTETVNANLIFFAGLHRQKVRRGFSRPLPTGTALGDGLNSVFPEGVVITSGLAGRGARFQRTRALLNGHAIDLPAAAVVLSYLRRCPCPGLSSAALEQTMASFLNTVQHVAAIAALPNPILLVGLPIIQKFGTDPPISRFCEEPQSQRLWALLPPPMVAFFEWLRNDSSVVSLEQAILECDDITDAELQRQMEAPTNWIEGMKQAARRPTES